MTRLVNDEVVTCPSCGSRERGVRLAVFWDYDDPELEATVKARATCTDTWHGDTAVSAGSVSPVVARVDERYGSPSPTTTETGELVAIVREGIAVPDSHLASGFAITRHDDAQRALSTLRSRIEELERERNELRVRLDRSVDLCQELELELEETARLLRLALDDLHARVTSLQEARGLLERWMGLRTFDDTQTAQILTRTFLSSTKETE